MSQRFEGALYRSTKTLSINLEDVRFVICRLAEAGRKGSLGHFGQAAVASHPCNHEAGPRRRD